MEYIKQQAGTYSDYSKQLYKQIDLQDHKRSQSAKPIKIKGLKYQFVVVDLGKYSDRNKYGNFNWPVKYCTIGRKIGNS